MNRNLKPAAIAGVTTIHVNVNLYPTYPLVRASGQTYGRFRNISLWRPDTSYYPPLHWASGTPTH